MTFAERLDAAVERTGTVLCLGLDPTGSDAREAERECLELLDAALDLVCAVKPNLAFFEQHGSAGLAVLERVRSRIPGERIVVLDAKRGDISSTADAYARALFDVWGADAVTASPLLGEDSVRPLLRADRGVFILARTSNPGARDLLEAELSDGRAVYERIVELGLRWDPGGSVGFVVGATDPAAVAAVRRQAPEAPLLLPGVGAQGGDLERALNAAVTPVQRRVLLPVSRGIAAAAEGPRAAAQTLRRRIEQVLGAAAAT